MTLDKRIVTVLLEKTCCYWLDQGYPTLKQSEATCPRSAYHRGSISRGYRPPYTASPTYARMCKNFPLPAPAVPCVSRPSIPLHHAHGCSLSPTSPHTWVSIPPEMRCHTYNTFSSLWVPQCHHSTQVFLIASTAGQTAPCCPAPWGRAMQQKLGEPWDPCCCCSHSNRGNGSLVGVWVGYTLILVWCQLDSPGG